MKPHLFPLTLVAACLSAPLAYGQAASTLHPEKVIGSEKCADCHEEEVKAWKLSAHFRSDSVHRDAKTREEAEKIAKAMGLANANAMTTSPLCTECHFTRQKTGGATKTIGGVSCESCHGGGLDFYEIHGEIEKIPNRDERKQRSKAAGMLYPEDTALVGENCFNCHIIRDEKLVNVGGHIARSEGFNLVSWSQGEVRHNFYTPDHTRTKGENLPTTPERKRKLFVVGMLLDLEYSLRALSNGKTGGGAFRKAMGTRAHTIINKELPAVSKILGDAAPEELKKAAEIASAVKLSGDPKLVAAAADALKDPIKSLSDNHDGSALGALDSILPKKSKGTAWQP
ncbi:cytochrome c family protein [Luteolibacter algae]|uniref:Cytochrome c family protein n=1 Tax=Luteolibacter algae TaxID=454151 RepID=A0ABW5D4X6_9BACT